MFNRNKWRVISKKYGRNLGCSCAMPKKLAKQCLRELDDALYIIKTEGWFRCWRRIYKK